MEERTLEQKAADTVLQRAAKVKVGGKEYEATSPSIATLVLVSEAVSRLPRRKLDGNDIVTECLDVAKHCRPLGDIAAVLVLGARQYGETATEPCKGLLRRFSGLFRKGERTQETKGQALSREILETYSPRQLYDLVSMLLQRMELADFFAVTTFLTEVNMLKETKVETETTASGR